MEIRFVPIDSEHLHPTYALIRYFIFLKKPVGSSFIILSCINLQIQRVAYHYKYSITAHNNDNATLPD